MHQPNTSLKENLDHPFHALKGGSVNLLISIHARIEKY